MTLWRWLQDDKIGFPQPIRIGRRTYWSASAIAEFKAKAATGTRLSPASGEAVA
jgi:predicted DNA-binding transcriptional regulator AlpA